MNFNETLQQRRSVRKYMSTDISNETISQIIKAGGLAPSLCNLQPWRYKIIQKSDGIDFSSCTPMHFINDAPVVIACCLDKTVLSTVSKRTKELIHSGTLKETIYELLDPKIIKNTFNDASYTQKSLYISLGASLQQMSLQATALNLGSCIISLFNEDLVKSLLQIPDSLEVVALLPIGTPALSELNKLAPRLNLAELII